MRDLQVCQLGIHLTGQVKNAASPCRAVADLTGVGFGVAAQFLQRLHWQCRIDNDNVVDTRHQGNRRETGDRVPRDLLVQGRVDGIGAVVPKKQRVSVGHGLRHHRGADIAARTTTVVYHHRLP